MQNFLLLIGSIEKFSKMSKYAKFGVNLRKNEPCQFSQNFSNLCICLLVCKKHDFVKFACGFFFFCWYDLLRNFSKMSKYARFGVNLRKNEPSQLFQNFRNLCICLLIWKKLGFVKFVCGIIFCWQDLLRNVFENAKICQVWGKSVKKLSVSVISKFQKFFYMSSSL